MDTNAKFMFISFCSAADLYIIKFLKEFSERMGGAVRMHRICSKYVNKDAIHDEVKKFASFDAEDLIQPGSDKCQGTCLTQWHGSLFFYPFPYSPA